MRESVDGWMKIYHYLQAIGGMPWSVPLHSVLDLKHPPLELGMQHMVTPGNWTIRCAADLSLRNSVEAIGWSQWRVFELRLGPTARPASIPREKALP